MLKDGGMNVEGVANGLYRLCVWIMRFAYVNFLWIVFSIFGLMIFGALPATVAMFTVVRKWIIGNKDIAIFQTFWKAYQKDFFKANIVGYILLIIGYILSIEWQILRASDHIVYYIASFGVVALIILYMIIMMYFFPVFVHFNLKLREYLKWPFVIGILHPILTVFLLVVICFLHYMAYEMVPALLFFFGGSVTAFILMWGAVRVFPKFETADG